MAGREPAPAAEIEREVTSTGGSLADPIRKWIVRILSLAACAFYLYTAVLGQLPFQLQRGLLLAVSLAVVFLQIPSWRRAPRCSIGLDGLLAVLSLLVVGHLVVRYDAIVLSGTLGTLDLVIGIGLIVLVLEATRRAVGLSLPIVTVLFIAYAYAGGWLPGILAHRGISPDYIVYYTATSTEGIWGPILAAMANVVLYFVAFAAFFRVVGGGDVLTGAARSLLGHVRGGPGKIAVAASSIFGMMSGSVIANIVGTGAFTIPLMKRTGFRPEFAGAVEAVASTGGQIMPPVMGTAAFLMAEFLGISYVDVLIAAVWPALLYYWGLFFMVDLEAVKLGLRGVPRSELPALGAVLARGWPVLIPGVVLMYLLAVEQRSPMQSAFWALLAIVVVSRLAPRVRLGLIEAVKACEETVRDIAGTVAAVACAGITIGLVNVTGLGFNLSSTIIGLANGHLGVVLVLTMIVSLVLGMGLPVVAVYLILAVLVAPTLVTLGVTPIGAHLFVFYFGLMSGLTPPVAIAAYVAAGLAGSNAMRTAVVACRLAFPGLIVPFMFVYHPSLLLQGSLGNIAVVVVTSALGITLLAIAVQGFAFGPVGLPARVVFAVAGLSLLHPGSVTDAFGAAVAIVTLLLHWRRLRDRIPRGTGWDLQPKGREERR